MSKNEHSVKKKNKKPAQAPRFHIEIDGTQRGTCFLIDGVLGISEFNRDNMKLIMKYGSLTLFGNYLSVAVYQGGTLEVKGNVDGMKISYVGRGKQSD